MWRIYYADGSVVDGETANDWVTAPDDGVQVVISLNPGVPLRWHYSGGPVRGYEIWTGEDIYNPFGWGVKHGSLMSDADYTTIWERACGDSIA